MPAAEQSRCSGYHREWRAASRPAARFRHRNAAPDTVSQFFIERRDGAEMRGAERRRPGAARRAIEHAEQLRQARVIAACLASLGEALGQAHRPAPCAGRAFQGGVSQFFQRGGAGIGSAA